MKDLTIQQLENQSKAINAARFLMENSYGASETTIEELNNAFKAIQKELDYRR